MKNINKKALITACVAASMTLSFNTAAALDSANFPIVDSTSSNITDISVTGDQMNIVQNGLVGAIDWNSYNIGAGKTVNYDFDNANSLSINRVTGANMSVINGNITQSGAGGGHVILVNPNGIYLGPTANISLEAFTASTHNAVKLNGSSGLLNNVANIDNATVFNNLLFEDLDLSNYGIFIDGATITTDATADKDNLNILSTAIKMSDATLNGGNVNINNFTDMELRNDTGLGLGAGANFGVNPDTVEILDQNGIGTVQNQALVTTGSNSITGREVTTLIRANNIYANHLINLAGIVKATEGDINITESNNQVNIADGAILTAEKGSINIKTITISDDQTEDIVVGNDVTFSAKNDINISTYFADKNTGNLIFGDNVTFNDETKVANPLGNINIQTGNYLNVNDDKTFGNITFGSDADLNATGDINIIASSLGNNVKGGYIQFGNHTLINSDADLVIKTKSTRAGEKSSITFGNFDSTETDPHIWAKEIEISTSTSGNLAGDINFGNDMFMKQKVGASSAIDIVSTGGTISGDINFGNNNKIEAIKGISINSSTVGDNETSGDINFNGAINLASTDGAIILNSESSGVNARSGNIVFNGDTTLTNENAEIGIISKVVGNEGRSGNIIFNDDVTLTNENSNIYMQTFSFNGNNQVSGNITFNGDVNVTVGNISKTGGYFKLETITSNSSDSVSGDITFKGTVDINSDNLNYIDTQSIDSNSKSGNITFEGDATINSNNSNYIYSYSNGANSTSGNITFEGYTTINAENGSNFIAVQSQGLNSKAGNITFKKGVNMITKDNIIFRTGVTLENSNAGNIIFGDDSSLLSKERNIYFKTFASSKNSNAGDVIFKGDTDITGGSILFEAGAHPVNTPTGRAGSIYWDNMTFSSPISGGKYIKFDVLSVDSGIIPSIQRISDTTLFRATFNNINTIDYYETDGPNSAKSGTIGNPYIEPTPIPIVSKPSSMPEPSVLSKTTDGVFGETQNQQNNANANTGNPELNLNIESSGNTVGVNSMLGQENIIINDNVLSQVPSSSNIAIGSSPSFSEEKPRLEGKNKSSIFKQLFEKLKK